MVTGTSSSGRSIRITQFPREIGDRTGKIRRQISDQVEAVLTGKKTHIAVPVSGNFASIENGDAKRYGAWAHVGLLQFAHDVYGLDGTGIRFKINNPEKLSDHVRSAFNHLDKKFQLKVEEASPKIAILDYGSQYTGNILSSLRKQGFDAEIYDHTTTRAELQSRIDSGEIKGVILSGGPDSVYDENALTIDPEFFENPDVPVLGICYGMQVMAHNLKGHVTNEDREGEYGPTEIQFSRRDKQRRVPTLNKGIKDGTVIMSHRDTVTEVPKGFDVLASTDKVPVAAMADPQRKLYGVQFHPEVSKPELLVNFARDIAGIKPLKTSKYQQFIDDAKTRIKEVVGDKKVLLGLSGGVDSTVLAYLLEEAIPGQVHYRLVDHGFMRKGEVEKLTEIYKEKFGDRFSVVDAQETFYRDLDEAVAANRKILTHILATKCNGEQYKPVTELDHRSYKNQSELIEDYKDRFGSSIIVKKKDGFCVDLKEAKRLSENEVISSKKKRSVIGGEFIDTFQTEIESLKESGEEIAFIGQGTILSDIMESGKKKIVTKGGEPKLEKLRDEIKAHHNVGGLPDKVKSTILEPIRDLLKNEVREVGRQLKVPSSVIDRQPFPGPGLAIRIPGVELTPELVSLSQEANHIFDTNMMTKSKAYKDIDWTKEVFFQYYAGLFATSKALEKSSKSDEQWLVRQIKALPGAQKYIAQGYDIKLARQPFNVVGTKGDARSNHPPLVIQFVDNNGKPVKIENTTGDYEKKDSDLTIKDLRDLAREIAGINYESQGYDIARVFYQVGEDRKNAESKKAIAMRAVDTVDVMTGNVVDISDILSTTAEQIKTSQPEISRVFYDITDKPPGTIEFE